MTTTTFSSNQLCALDHLSVLHIRGSEARSFMQSQLTNAVESLSTELAVLAGFCQAKGRLQATMLVYVDANDNQNLYAVLPTSIAETVRKRLSMFLLRTKAELVATELRVYGVTPCPTVSAFSLPCQSYPVHHTEAGTLIAAPSHDNSSRAWLISATNLDADLSATQWQAADMYAGLAWLSDSTYETFLPQDINLDIIGGVSFKKGCFPGQEVVARLHYRSIAKRRAAVGVIGSDLDLNLLPGDDIYEAAADRAFGRIINSVYVPEQQQQVVLIEALIEDLEQKDLRVQRADGPAIKLQPLPYDWTIAKY